MSESRAAIEEAIQLAPDKAEYRRHFGDLTKYENGDPNLVAMEQLLQDSARLSVDDRIHLHFVLAKAYDDVGRYAEAFRQWLAGNSLKRQHITYDEAAVLATLDRTQAVFTSDLVRTWQNSGVPSALPIFIVGMPRSGSTLIEQILASHPRVFAGGEMTHFQRAVKAIRTRVARGNYNPYRSGSGGRVFVLFLPVVCRRTELRLRVGRTWPILSALPGAHGPLALRCCRPVVFSMFTTRIWSLTLKGRRGGSSPIVG